MNDRTPAVDPLEASILDSTAGRALSGAAGRLRRAWAASTVRRFSTAAAVQWVTWTASTRIRAVAVAIAVAMITDRTMQLFARQPADPLSAALPVSVLAVSIVVAVFSGAVARVREHLRT
jgi:hypothetical protein